MPFVCDEEKDARKSNCQAHLILIVCVCVGGVAGRFLIRIIAFLCYFLLFVVTAMTESGMFLCPQRSKAF